MGHIKTCILCGEKDNLLLFPFFLHCIETTFLGDYITEECVGSIKPFLCRECIRKGLIKACYTWLWRYSIPIIGLVGATFYFSTIPGNTTHRMIWTIISIVSILSMAGFYYVYFIRPMNIVKKLPERITDIKNYFEKEIDIMRNIFSYYVKPLVLKKYKTPKNRSHDNHMRIYFSGEEGYYIELCQDCYYYTEGGDGLQKKCEYLNNVDDLLSNMRPFKCANFRRIYGSGINWEFWEQVEKKKQEIKS